MRQRCRDDPRYAGRVRICAEWESSDAFIRWAEENGYREGLTLDRIDPNGHYEPANCRWATALQQSLNKRVTIKVVWRGEEMPLIEACRLENINYWTVRSRLKAGKSLSEALGDIDETVSEGPLLRPG